MAEITSPTACDLHRLWFNHSQLLDGYVMQRRTRITLPSVSVLLVVSSIFLSGCSMLGQDHPLARLDLTPSGLKQATQWVLPRGYSLLMRQGLKQADCGDLRLRAHLDCLRQYDMPYSVYLLEREQVLEDAAERESLDYLMGR